MWKITFLIAIFNYCFASSTIAQSDGAKAVMKEAKKGNALYQLNLALFYEFGLEIEQDYEQAAYWCRKAADQGLDKAQFILGSYYSKGIGVKTDLESAVYWFKKAADQGCDQACFILGTCYESGKGIEQDYEQAAFWYRKAADQGHKDAKEFLEHIKTLKQVVSNKDTTKNNHSQILIQPKDNSKKIVEMTSPRSPKDRRISKDSHYRVRFDMSDEHGLKVTIYEERNINNEKNIIKEYNFSYERLLVIPGDFFEDTEGEKRKVLWITGGSISDDMISFSLSDKIRKKDDWKEIESFTFCEEWLREDKSTRESPYLESKENYKTKTNKIREYLYKHGEFCF